MLYGSNCTTYNNYNCNYNSSAVYYFLIANNTTHKEIGSFSTSHDINITEFNTVISKSKEIFKNAKLIHNNTKNRYVIDNYNLYYIITTSNTFYLAAVHKKSTLVQNENLVFELIEDIEHQGIKKLIDRNGELTNVGKQNLKFSIEKYQDSARCKYANIITDGSSGSGSGGIVDTTMSVMFSGNEIEMNENVCKGKDEDEDEGKVNEYNNMDYDDKKERMKDLSVEFRQGNTEVNDVNKKKKYKMQIVFAVIIIVIISFILMYMLK